MRRFPHWSINALEKTVGAIKIHQLAIMIVVGSQRLAHHLLGHFLLGLSYGVAKVLRKRREVGLGLQTCRSGAEHPPRHRVALSKPSTVLCWFMRRLVGMGGKKLFKSGGLESIFEFV